MTPRVRHAVCLACPTLLLIAASLVVDLPLAAQPRGRLFYTAGPGSLLVFDIDRGHRFVTRIPIQGGAAVSVAQGFSPAIPRGLAVHAQTNRLYLATVGRIIAMDLATSRSVWEKTFDGHCCDRLGVSPDGTTIYAPAFEKPRWYVLRAADGELVAGIDAMGWPRQTVYSRDGRYAYLSAWESKTMWVADARAHKVLREVGPFGDFVCPFTVNRKASLVFANVDGLLGFEVADLQTGLVLDRVIVEGSDEAAWPRYECPSHGIALTRGEDQLWLADGVDNRLHIFDATSYPPVAAGMVQLRAQPLWIAFSNDGKYAYAGTEVIDTATRTIVATLQDEHGNPVRSDVSAVID